MPSHPIIDTYCTPGTERETLLAPEELLGEMDRAGIHQALIAPEDGEIAVENRAGNDRILEMAGRSNGRFLPACTVNPWFGEAGCSEFRRAVRAGARMLVLAPALQGFCLGDVVTNPLLTAAAELRVPVYVHTGPHSSSAPTQLVLLALEHPGARFILGHFGSTDYAHDMPFVLQTAPANVWFETSLARPWAVAAYVKMVDESRLIFGSSAPRGDPAYELEHLDTFWPVAEHPGTYGGNLARLIEEVRC